MVTAATFNGQCLIIGSFRAYSRGSGGPRAGEVLHRGGVTNLSIQSLFFFLGRVHMYPTKAGYPVSRYG